MRSILVATSVAALLTACAERPVLDCDMQDHAVYDRSSEVRGAATSAEALAQVDDSQNQWEVWRPDASSGDRVTHWVAVSPAQTIVGIVTTELTASGWFVVSSEFCA